MHQYRSNKKTGIMMTLFLCACLACPALAAAAPNAGEISNTLKDSQVKPAEKKSGGINVESLPEMQPDLSGPKIKVNRIRISGQTIYSEAQLEGITSSVVGQEVTFGELEQAAGKIAKYFRDNGYLLANAFVTAQEIKDGQVTIQVVVGQYGDVTVRNTSRLSDHYIKAIVKPLKNGDAIHIDSLERVLLILNEVSGITLKSTLAPGKEPGTSDLIMEISDAPVVSGQLYGDNWGNRFTGEIRGGLNININNLSRQGDVLTVGGLYGGSGLRDLNFDYALPVGSEGGKIGVTYSNVNYLLGEEYAVLGASGQAKARGIYATYPLHRSRNANLYLRIGFERKELQDLVGSSATDSQKKVDAWNVGLKGDWRDAAGDGSTAFGLALTQGRLNMLSADARNNDDLKTAGSYSKAIISLLRQKYINERLSYNFSFTGQLASKNLDSVEKLFLGGATGVRAYPQGEAGGDSGYLVTGELRWNMPTPNFQLAAFIDSGQVTLNKAPLNNDANTRALTGGGLGVVFSRNNDYSIRADYAWKISSDKAVSDHDKNGRFWLRAIKYF
ncbi:ShlB/FhaC/HecB family hemolysin secretion/activation protein [Azotosporobacter soli]|uniref:ShlB/FhaC/HecB family hemolysin secretion/activation protein n=1 Tax=Azotosporobacter soli TaxID=3055040 RepID=UPI0031FF395A